MGTGVGRVAVHPFSVLCSHHEVYIDDEQFTWLEVQLEEHKDRPVIIFTHAPPIGCGLTVGSRQGLKDSGCWVTPMRAGSLLCALAGPSIPSCAPARPPIPSDCAPGPLNPFLTVSLPGLPPDLLSGAPRRAHQKPLRMAEPQRPARALH